MVCDTFCNKEGTHLLPPALLWGHMFLPRSREETRRPGLNTQLTRTAVALSIAIRKGHVMSKKHTSPRLR